MAAERHLGDVSDDERRGAFVLVELLDRLADVLLLHRLDFKLINRFIDAVQRLFESHSGIRRVYQRLHHVGQLANCAHADFVPVEIVLLQRRKHLLGCLIGRILKQARKKQMVEQRAVLRRRHGLVVLSQDLNVPID